jgi:hypothetical protein
MGTLSNLVKEIKILDFSHYKDKIDSIKKKVLPTTMLRKKKKAEGEN